MFKRIKKAFGVLFRKPPQRKPRKKQVDLPEQEVVLYFLSFDFYYTKHFNGGQRYEGMGDQVISVTGGIKGDKDIVAIRQHFENQIRNQYPNPKVRINNYQEIRRWKQSQEQSTVVQN